MSNNPGNTSERIGLSSFMETEQFMMGMMTYLNGLNRMNNQTTQTASAMTGALGGAAQRTGKGLSEAGTQSNVLEQSFSSLMLRAVALGSVIGNFADRILTSLIGKIKELVTTGIDAAARVQELDFVLQVIGQRTGYTTAQIRELVAGVRDFGIRTDIAQNLIQQFIRYELDLAKATDLARVAQDAAVISMTDSSEMLDRMIWGISKFDTQILRTGGINIPSATVAFEKYAETLDKTADQLTINEKQQAFLNAVLEEGARNAGIYEAAMEAPGKQLRSLGRYTWELARVMGAPFLGAFGQVVKMMSNITKAFKKAIDEGGVLHNMFLVAGAVALFFAEKLRMAAEKGVEYLINALTYIPQLLQQFVEFITGMATDAFEWGSNIIGNLAEGMLYAASAVLDALMYIGQMITTWLMPGSPPKLLPDLPMWGAKAATEWVKGWKAADFSTFNELAGTVEKFLKTMKIDEKNVIPTIMGSRKAIADAINMVHEAGMVTEEALDRIMKSVKGLPASFRDYARALLEVENANKAVEVATETYNNAQNLTLENADELISMFSGDLASAASNYIASLKDVVKADNDLYNAQYRLNRITEFYDGILASLNAELDALSNVGEDTRLQEINDALASGMLTQEEQASLLTEKRQIELRKQIDAVEAQKDAEVSAAEERINILDEVKKATISQAELMRSTMMEIAAIQVETAQQQKEALDEQLQTQKALIAFQTEQNDLVKQQLELLKQLAEAAAGGAGAGGELPEGMGAAGFNLDNIKDEMNEKIEGMKSAFENKMNLWINSIRGKIRLFLTKLPIYQELKRKFAQVKLIWGDTFVALQEWLQDKIPQALDTFKGFWDEKIVPAFQNLKMWYDQYVAPALAGIWEWIGVNLPPALEAFGNFWEETLGPALQAIFTFLGEHIDEIAAFVAGILAVTGGFMALMSAGTAIAGVLAWVSGIVGTLSALFVAFTSPIGLVALAVGALAAAWTGNWFGIRDTLTDVWTNTVYPVLENLWKWLSENVPLAIETLRGWWEDTLLPALTNVWNWINENIFPMFQTMYDWLYTTLTEAIENLRSWWEDTLLPAFQTAHDWFTGTYFPFWESLRNLLEVLLVAAITSMQTKWEDLKTRLTEIWEWLSGTFKPIWDDIYDVLLEIWSHIYSFLNPIWTAMSNILTTLWGKIHSLWDVLKNTLMGTLQELYDSWLVNIQTAFSDITTVIQTLTTWFNKLATAISGLPPPPPLYEPGSPTPFEMGLRGIRDQMKGLYSKDLPKMASALTKLPTMDNIPSVSNGNGSRSVVNNFNNTKNVSVDVAANYAKTQSHASVRYDVTAALNNI